MNTAKQSIKHLVTRSSRLFIAVIFVATIAPQILNVKPAAADDSGYPWIGATTLNSSTSDYGYATCPTNDTGCMSLTGVYNGTTYGEADPWVYNLRNCTSYAAWKVNQQFNANVHGWGNAATWDTGATNAGYTVYIGSSHTPVVGELAQWGTEKDGGLGHVAYVGSVTNGVATLWEYNVGLDGIFYNTRTTTPGPAGTPDHYIHIGTVNGGSTSTANLVSNGDFNVNAASWSTTAGANMSQYPGNQNQASYEGAGYLATNSPQANGSVYQDIALTIANGNMYCAEAEITSIGSSGGNGTLAVWLTGGSYADSSSYVFSNLPQSTWTPFKTCVTATTSHTTIRVQVYDNIGSPTIGVDAVDVHRSLVKNGEFNTNASYWNTTASANMAQYPGNQNQASYEGAGYLSTNSPQSGGSVYQDIPLTISAGNMYCLETEITSIGSSGAHGSLALWLNGGSNAQESSYYVFSNLPQSTWKPIKTCFTATLSHTNIRAQIYDDVGSPTIGIDAVDVHRSLVQNGEFNANASHWSTTAGANMAQYPGNQNQASYEGAGYLSTNSSQSGGSVYQDIPVTISAGDMYCLEAEITSIGSSGGNGTLAIWMTGGSYSESSSYVFSSLPQSTWTPFKTCVTATTSHTTIRVQVYDNVGSPTIGIDAVDVH